MTILLALLLGGYLVAIFVVGLVASRRVETEEDYVVAGRRLPLFLAWATLLATWFGAATVLGAAEAARAEGLRGTVLDPFASGVALIVAGLFFARPLWSMRLLTIADFYGRKFGNRSELAAAVILVPGYFGWIAAQFIALAGIQSAFFGIDTTVGILVAATIVLSYTLIGGMWSVTLTDAVQMAVIFVTLLILGGATLSRLGGGGWFAGLARLLDETPADRLTLMPEAGGVALVAWIGTWAAGVFGNIPGQDLLQRVFAAKSARVAAQACLVSGVLYLSFGLIPVGLGLASNVLLPGTRAGDIVGILAAEFLHPVLSVVFVVALVSVIVSTATSAVLSPATILGHNLLARIPAFRENRLLINRLAVVVVGLASVAVAFSGRSILDLLELSVSMTIVALFVPLVGGLFFRPAGERSALLAMAFGALIWLAREALEFGAAPAPMPAEPSLPELAWFAFRSTPSALSGTAASLLGYLIGVRLDRRFSGTATD